MLYGIITATPKQVWGAPFLFQNLHVSSKR